LAARAIKANHKICLHNANEHVQNGKMLIAYSKSDEVGSCIASHLTKIVDFNAKIELINTTFPYSDDIKAALIELNGELVNAEYLDGIGMGTILFLSKHSSAKNVPAYTVHATGNWSGEALLGGKPRALSVSDPMLMCALLHSISKRNKDSAMQVTYEATHHGPLLDTPSVFVEIEKNSFNDERCMLVARSIVDAIKNSSLCKDMPIAIGIGGTHYSARFTSIALSGKYAFSHIMPKYYVDEIAMAKHAIERSVPKASLAVIEWKSINSAKREIILRELEKSGIPYERV